MLSPLFRMKTFFITLLKIPRKGCNFQFVIKKTVNYFSRRFQMTILSNCLTHISIIYTYPKFTYFIFILYSLNPYFGQNNVHAGVSIVPLKSTSHIILSNHYPLEEFEKISPIKLPYGSTPGITVNNVYLFFLFIL